MHGGGGRGGSRGGDRGGGRGLGSGRVVNQQYHSNTCLFQVVESEAQPATMDLLSITLRREEFQHNSKENFSVQSRVRFQWNGVPEAWGK